MENWYYIFIPVVLIVVLLTLQLVKIKKELNVKSNEVQQKIEDVKKKNRLMENKQINTTEQLSQVSQIFKQVSKLHKLVFHKYFK